MRLLYNVFAEVKIGLDKWAIIDGISAVLNIGAVELIKNVPPDYYLIPHIKDLIDYFVLLVLVISWLRFFTYFLVIREISKLILTLIAMVGDAASFFFILVCYMLIMASIFETLF